MKKLFIALSLIASQFNILAQSNENSKNADSSSHNIEQLLIQNRAQATVDSIIKSQLQEQLLNVTVKSKEKEELEKKLKNIELNDSINKAKQIQKIENLKKTAIAFPVMLFEDTILLVYTKIGSFSPKERADAITSRIKKLYENDLLKIDSIKLVTTESSVDIIYNNDETILSVNDVEAMWYNTSKFELANKYRNNIVVTLTKYKEQNSYSNMLKRIGQMALIVLCLVIVIILINKLFKKLKNYLEQNQDRFLNGLTIRNFKLFTPERHRKFAFQANNALRLLVIILFVYLSLPLIFSVFPETKSYTDTLIDWILSPAKSVLNGIIHFLPNLFTILVIYFVTRWTIKGVKYFFDEISNEGITLKGFHKDWALPTFNIIKFLLYAFMVVLIFPYLPGSNSPAFQGVSVFLGVLLSLGSSSAITNMIAGLVITYMRPFKIGDRVKVGEVTGDILEKTMLVTRIRTIKNEDITVPNATVLSSYTVNYSSNANDSGLIVHSTVTIGYDVPWKKMHQALIDAALRTDLILKEPKPFVLQTSLDDFYVSYQINAYTREPNKQAVIYSELHKNIQDCCNEVDIEILSPHYRAMRDGNHTTIPNDYLGKDYKAPEFNVNIKKEE